MAEAKKKMRRQGPRSGLILACLVVIAASLIAFNAFSFRRDARIATGPPTPAQRALFIAMADRPDLALFYKNLTSAQRVQVAANLAKHQDPKVVELAAKLLDTFDEAARARLTESLKVLAQADPETVSDQLKLGASFQRLAVFDSLKASVPASLPYIASRFATAEHRPNAVQLMVEIGRPAVPHLLKLLDDELADTRRAAADALGKIQAREAVPKLLALYAASEDDEQLDYLTALASIGDPSTESLMDAAIRDTRLPISFRAQAALGLGRIGTPRTIATLVSFTDTLDRTFLDSLIQGLRLAGEPAVLAPGLTPAVRLEVAAGVGGRAALTVVEQAIAQDDLATVRRAAELSSDRPELVPAMATRLRRLDPDRDGRTLDALMRSLSTTAEGRAELAAIARLPGFAPFAMRLGIRTDQARGEDAVPEG